MPSSALATIAIAQSAAALQEAENSKEASRCAVVIQHFDSKNTSISAMQDYAHCVNELFPPSKEQSIEVGFVCAWIILFTAIGAWRYRKEELVMGGIMGLSIGLVGLLVIALFYGVWQAIF